MFSRWGITPLGSFASENQQQQIDNNAPELLGDHHQNSTENQTPAIQIAA
jgi:hypothetical protein